MPAPRRASAGEIVLLIRAALASSLGWDADRIPILAGKAECPHLMGNQEVLIRVQGEHPDRAQIDEAGRRINRRTRNCEIECRTRLYLDPSHEDRLRLTDASLGHLALEDAIAECLECTLSTATDDAGRLLIAGVVRLHDLSDPTPDKDAREWVSSHWSLEFSYDRSFTNLTRV